MPDSNDTILWRDRKRYLGLPISFTQYELTEERITVRKGLLSTSVEDVMLYRILDSGLKRTLGQKLFGLGTVTLHTADRTAPELLIENVRDSERVRRLISQLVEDERLKRRVGAREMYLGQDFVDGDEYDPML